jgi:uncharacterized protein YegL
MQEKENSDKSQQIVSESIRRKAEIISLFMGEDYNMTVGLGPWGGGWNWDFVRNHISMDPKDLVNEPEDVIKGLASHEGSHRRVSRTERVMDLWQEPGFAYGFNAVEDPRANEGGMHFRPGTRDWIKAYIEKDLSPGGGLDYEGIEQKAKDSLGYVPDFMKWGAEMIRYWHGKELSSEITSDKEKQEFVKRIPDESVRDLVKKTLDYFEKYYKTIPTSGDEMEIQRKAMESSENFLENIWPEYQKLVKKSYEDHSMVKMLEDEMDNQNQSGGSNGSGQQTQQTGKSGESGKSSGLPSPSSSKLPGDVSKEIQEKQNQSGKDDSGKEQKSGQAQNGTTSQSEEGEQSEYGKVIKIPWDKLSEKAKQAVKKAFQNLPKDKQDEYREKARQDLENAEDDANSKLRGKMNDPRYIKTHEEQEAEDAKEKDDQNQSDSRKKAIKKMIDEIEDFKKKIPENPYFYYLNLPEVDLINRTLKADLRYTFKPDEDPDVRYTSTGLRPSMKNAMKSDADSRYSNIFEAHGLPTEKRYRFYILIDLSTSMAGDKIEETFKALVPIIENLNYYGVEFAIAGYSSDIKNTVNIYKSFEAKKLTWDLRNRIGEIILDVGGGTPTYEATDISYRKLVKRMSQVNIDHNYFITLTDGDPTDSTYEDVLKYTQEINKSRKIITAGYGIGTGSGFVNKSYPELPREIKAVIARKIGKNIDEVGNDYDSAVEFGSVFAIIIGYMIKRPELFFR